MVTEILRDSLRKYTPHHSKSKTNFYQDDKTYEVLKNKTHPLSPKINSPHPLIRYNRLSIIQMDTGNDQTDCGVHELSTSEQESSTQDDSSSTMGEVSSSFAPKVLIKLELKIN